MIIPLFLCKIFWKENFGFEKRGTYHSGTSDRVWSSINELLNIFVSIEKWLNLNETRKLMLIHYKIYYIIEWSKPF